MTISRHDYIGDYYVLGMDATVSCVSAQASHWATAIRMALV